MRKPLAVLGLVLGGATVWYLPAPPADAGWCGGGGGGAGSAPSTGGVSSGGTPSRKTGDPESDRFASSPWMDLVLTALSAGTGDEGAKDQAAADQLRRMVRVSEMDLKPAFLYFHHPHEEDEKATPEGRASKKQCSQLVDDQVCRWASLYRCWEVDMGRSDAATAAKLGADAGTSFAVVDGGLRITAKSGPFANSKATVQFLRETLEKNSPVYWGQIQERLEAQKALLAEARKLAAKKEWKESYAKYTELLQSDLRIGDFWDDMLAESVKVEAKAKSAKDE